MRRGGGVSAAKSGKVAAMTSLAARPRRHLDVRFGSLAAATTDCDHVRFTPESCRGSYRPLSDSCTAANAISERYPSRRFALPRSAELPERSGSSDIGARGFLEVFRDSRLYE
jgi:hypothetical protein